MNKDKSISVSSLSTFLSCPRKFFYQHEMRWYPQTEADALTFGKAWHGWLEYFGKSGKAYREALKEYIETNKDALASSLNNDALSMLIAMALEFERVAGDLGTIVESETPFSFRIPTTSWRVDGVIDAIGDNGCPIEYKTTSSNIEVGDFYWLRLKANLQAIVYAVATEASEVRYVVARKPRIQRRQVPLLDEAGKKIVTYADGSRAYNANGTPRQTSGEGLTLATREETSDELIERMRADIAERTSYSVKTVNISDGDKLLAIETLIAGVRQIDILRKRALKSSRPDTPFIRNCTEFNCKGCPYQGICLDINVNPLEGVPQGFISKLTK